eukprot:TRINITY_DN4178_c0_g1_i2.p1 TRINITY_DN4178_c0_g1~~TRINITY_DN4178_c0_g1_i2.p1  ORF type:complete len:459 (+),score=197.97 TRINITY_DN4178_c0_g1_i2:175-1551(+)
MNEKIKREIQVLKLFRHPHIIKLYEVIETPTDIFMVMEFVSGGELFEFIVNNGRISENEARRFFQQIIAGVEYCHKHMVVHRDLKPENLLLDSNANVKIADFGLSNMMRDGDFLKTSCGSPNYAAPEVISGQLYAGPEVDVWSCGVILFALVCARLPFDDEYIPNLFKKIREGVYVVPDFVSPECKDLIASMLVVDPLKRTTIEEIRDHPWFKKNLPNYLRYSPESSNNRILEEIDESVVNELVQKMNIARERALHELSKKETNEVNPFVVAYHLIYDSRQIYASEIAVRNSAQAIAQRKPLITTFCSTSPPLNLREQVPFTQEDSEQSNSNVGTFDLRSVDIINGSTVIAPPPIKRAKFRLGLMTHRSPKQTITSLLNLLREKNFEWKTVTPFQFICRSKNYEESRGTKVKFGIQIYRLKEGAFLVDFKKLEGDNLVFFTIANQILSVYEQNKQKST